MSQKLPLPDSVFQALEQAAKASGTTPAAWIAAHLPEITPTNDESLKSDNNWIDQDFLKTYASEGDDSISLEVVRQAMAKIPGRLADDIRAERDER